MKTSRLTVSRWLLALILLFGFAQESYSVIITRNASTNMYVDLSDSPQFVGTYVMFSVTNNDGVSYSNLWVTIGNFTNTLIALGGGDSGLYNLGTLTTNAEKPASFYLQATNSAGACQYTVSLYRGHPSVGTLLTSTNFATGLVPAGSPNNNKINSFNYSPAQPVVGGIITVTVTGQTAPLNSGRIMSFTPASHSNWNAYAFQLEQSVIILTNSSSYFYTNKLFFTQPGSNAKIDWSAEYRIRALAMTPSTNDPSPEGIFATGGASTYEHSSATVALPAVVAATNAVFMTGISAVSQLYTNEVVTFTLRFTNGSGSDVFLDRVVDTLPAGFYYVSNSTTFNGVFSANPIVSNQVVTWSERFTVTAGANSDLVFQAVPTNVIGFFTNSAVAYIGSTILDTTLNTADNAPATSVVRVLWEPRATNDVGSVLEDASLNSAAPGVLANDSEPNGFTLTVTSYTQPAHGSVTVSADGSYAYSPAADYNGLDSFNYTLTNGNARASVGTVNLTVTAVNDPPTLDPIGNTTINEEATLQTVNLTGISAGPANESAQVVTITATSSNPLLVPDPTVNYTDPSATGSLTFTPVTNAYGTATITIIVADNGGTANGGIAAITNSFTVTVNGVNDPPTLDPIGNLTINEDAGLQTVNLTGISAGPGESGQVLTITATSDNTALIPNPSVNYTSPGATGSLTFTPVSNAYGAATITVVVRDDAGGADSITNTFTVTVNSVNDAPTLDAIPDLSLTVGDGEQTINLAGISAGAPDEIGQTLTVTATSSNPSLVPNPTVDYTSPNATGTLTFTPATNQLGSATITVVVQDNGGTANGGVNAVTNFFTVTILSFNVVWGPDESLTNSVSDASGTPGVGWDFLSIAGGLDIQATSDHPFTIELVSLDGASPGPAANFDADSTNLWTIATAAGGVTGFDPAKFAFDSSSFSNDLAGGVFVAELSGDGKSVNVVFLPNHAPVANGVSVEVAENTSITIAALVNDTDPDGDTLTLAGVITTNGTAVIQDGTNIVFTPETNYFGDVNLIYTVSDGRDRTADGLILVSVEGSTNVWLPDGGLPIGVSDATGLPNEGYIQAGYNGVLDVQATSDHPFVISLLSFDGGDAGPAANFDYRSNYTWTVATTTRGVIGFDPAKFVVNDSGFSNDLAGSTFTVALSGDGNSVNVVFQPNHAPVAGAATYGRAWGTELRVPIAALLANYTSDPDSDARGLVLTGASTNGSWIATNANYIYFVPTNNASESFQYVIRDLRAYRVGDTILTATNLLTVSVTNAVGQVQTIVVSGANALVRFAGVPGFAYDVERTTNLFGGTWEVVLTTNAPARGAWEFLDTNPPTPQAFYRLKQH